MTPIVYMSSLLTFYLKGEIKSEQNFVSFRIPNTILGLIPLGAHKDRVAVNQIAAVSTDTKLLLKTFLIGVIAALLGLSVMGTSFLVGLILLIYGASSILNAMQVNLVVTLTSGHVKVISFLIFEKVKATQAEEQINAMIAGRLDDTNNRQQTDRIVDAINRK